MKPLYSKVFSTYTAISFTKKRSGKSLLSFDQFSIAVLHNLRIKKFEMYLILNA